MCRGADPNLTPARAPLYSQSEAERAWAKLLMPYEANLG